MPLYLVTFDYTFRPRMTLLLIWIGVAFALYLFIFATTFYNIMGGFGSGTNGERDEAEKV